MLSTNNIIYLLYIIYIYTLYIEFIHILINLASAYFEGEFPIENPIINNSKAARKWRERWTHIKHELRPRPRRGLWPVIIPTGSAWRRHISFERKSEPKPCWYQPGQLLAIKWAGICLSAKRKKRLPISKALNKDYKRGWERERGRAREMERVSVLPAHFTTLIHIFLIEFSQTKRSLCRIFHIC